VIQHVPVDWHGLLEQSEPDPINVPLLDKQYCWGSNVQLWLQTIPQQAPMREEHEGQHDAPLQVVLNPLNIPPIVRHVWFNCCEQVWLTQHEPVVHTVLEQELLYPPNVPPWETHELFVRVWHCPLRQHGPVKHKLDVHVLLIPKKAPFNDEQVTLLTKGVQVWFEQQAPPWHKALVHVVFAPCHTPPALLHGVKSNWEHCPEIQQADEYGWHWVTQFETGIPCCTV